MKKLLLLFLLLLVFLLLSSVRADLNDVYQSRYQQLQENLNEQAKLKKQIAETQSQERTLNNQINYLNDQIRLTELQINATQTQIIQTQDQLIAVGIDIETLSEKLANLESSIGKLSSALAARVRATYQESFISPLEIFLSAEDFSQGVLKITYLKSLQQEDKKLLTQMQDARGNYLEQKARLEVLKQEKEQLKKDLESQKATLLNQQTNLANQKVNKQKLLELTKNDEANFKNLLAQRRAEQQDIERAVNNLLRQITGRVLPGTRVKRGDIIGIQGSTGLSTGDHVHFGYFTSACGNLSCDRDPTPLLNSGGLGWPLDSYEISQPYGPSDFWLEPTKHGYKNFHDGIDLVGPSSSAVRAAHDGLVYYTVDSHGGNGALLIDDSGFMTIYWHLQNRK